MCVMDMGSTTLWRARGPFGDPQGCPYPGHMGEDNPAKWSLLLPLLFNFRFFSYELFSQAPFRVPNSIKLNVNGDSKWLPHRQCNITWKQKGSFCLPSELIWGWYVSEVMSGRWSGLRLHTSTPSAAPAAMAAPRAVVSDMFGRTGRNTETIYRVYALYIPQEIWPQNGVTCKEGCEPLSKPLHEWIGNQKPLSNVPV